ncbi:MAG: hypothetical protein QG587_1012 [Chloroflexota bacterium]|nr:hypothetical protein [Chloroflexota bacterium]
MVWSFPRGRAILARVTLATTLLATTLLTASAVPSAKAASPGPSAAPGSGGSGGTQTSDLDLTGHWAVAGTSGFDIVQKGSRIDGTSIAGIRFAGTASGRAATFRFWEGTSFAKADPEDRGTGSFRVSPDGNMLFVSWLNEKPSKSSLDPIFTAVRVATIVERPSAPPEPTVTTWFTPANFQLAQWLAATLEYPLESVIGALILMSHPSPAQLREDAAAYEAMMYLFRDWDRNHGIKPRPEP